RNILAPSAICWVLLSSLQLGRGDGIVTGPVDHFQTNAWSNIDEENRMSVSFYVTPYEGPAKESAVKIDGKPATGYVAILTLDPALNANLAMEFRRYEVTDKEVLVRCLLRLYEGERLAKYKPLVIHIPVAALKSGRDNLPMYFTAGAELRFAHWEKERK